MRNRLLIFLPLVLLTFLFTTPASAALTWLCASVNEAETAIDLGLAFEDLNAGEVAHLGWEETDTNYNDAIHVKLEKRLYSAGYHPWEYFDWAHHSNDLGMNSHAWLVPPSYEDQTIQLRISDMADPSNYSTVVCNVGSSSAKKGNYLTNPGLEVTCFPNPVIDELKVFSNNGETPIQSIQLYDMTGNAIKTYFYEETFMETIDVADLPKGAYVAIINEEKQVKIIKN